MADTFIPSELLFFDGVFIKELAFDALDTFYGFLEFLFVVTIDLGLEHKMAVSSCFLTSSSCGLLSLEISHSFDLEV